MVFLNLCSECLSDEYMGLAHCEHGVVFDVDENVRMAKNLGLLKR